MSLKPKIVMCTYSIQKAACADVTGAVKSYPTKALNMILHQLLIDAFTRNVAAGSAFIIKELDAWNRK